MPDKTTATGDDLGAWNDLPGWFRALIITGLLTGTTGGFLGITADTSDRYYASQAKRDLELRDIKIQYTIDQLKDLKRTVIRIDETHPPVELLKKIDSLEARVWAIQIHLSSMSEKEQ